MKNRKSTGEKCRQSYTHNGWTIVPKRDFGPYGYLGNNGKAIRKGWIAVDPNGCNGMPGATWFQTVEEAREAIDVLLEVKGDADLFWAIMQPFYTHVGQKASKGHVSEHEVVVQCAGNQAIIRGGKVVDLTLDPVYIKASQIAEDLRERGILKSKFSVD